MNLYFTPIYTVPGMNFNLSFTYKLRSKLASDFNSLKMNIKKISARYKSEPYSVNIMIATKTMPTLDVRGPIWLRKQNDVEFVVWIPYIAFSDAHEQLEYVLGQIKAGIIFIFQKYQEDTTGIDEFFAKFLYDTINHLDAYK